MMAPRAAASIPSPMSITPRLLLLAALLCSIPPATCAPVAASAVPWLHDEAAAFEQAQRERRFVLLYLEAVWCHWCHVMDARTYADEGVIAALARDYVPLRIDQDARPDLANRYRDYGWPATIVFDPEGREIVKRQGYIAPLPMQRLLAAIKADPDPERAAARVAVGDAPASGLSAAVRAELQRRHRDTHDAERGGLRIGQKYVDRDSVEYALGLAARGDVAQGIAARKTLDAARALLDPVWGGVYQYSTGGDWNHPHFEKLAVLQAEYLRLYALAYAQTGEPRYLETARSIRGYIEHFLAAPEGGYYASQDADLRPGEHSAEYFALDDAARQRQGGPRVDTHRYTQATAAIAEAFAVLHEASNDAAALAAAERAMRWVHAERANGEGGFRHDANDRGGPFLADNLAAGRAFLQLYRVTSQREWLTQASATADFIERRFRIDSGYAGGVGGVGPIAPVAQLDENLSLVRFANLLAHYSGEARHQALAQHAFAYLARDVVALSRLTDAGILLADDERNADPLHLTVIGDKHDPVARALFDAALRLPGAYKRLDWWDPAEGALPNPDVKYPPVKGAAAFVCTQRRCSLPIREPAELGAFVRESSQG